MMDADVIDRFRIPAQQFCSVVDSVSTLDRTQILEQIYKILPILIHEAISLPDVELTEDGEEDDEEQGFTEEITRARLPEDPTPQLQEWEPIYNALKEKLRDWDLYCEVFDPTQDHEAIRGSLADDIADIYRDLKKGLVLEAKQGALPVDIVWEWRFSFQNHWGPHAMEALRTIHARLLNLE